MLRNARMTAITPTLLPTLGLFCTKGSLYLICEKPQSTRRVRLCLAKEARLRLAPKQNKLGASSSEGFSWMFLFVDE